MRDAEFTALQSKLRAFWPQITLRSIGDIERVVVVAHSVDHLDNPAYSSLTPDDLLDIVQDRKLGWDGERETGSSSTW